MRIPYLALSSVSRWAAPVFATSPPSPYPPVFLFAIWITTAFPTVRCNAIACVSRSSRRSVRTRGTARAPSVLASRRACMVLLPRTVQRPSPSIHRVRSTPEETGGQTRGQSRAGPERNPPLSTQVASSPFPRSTCTGIWPAHDGEGYVPTRRMRPLRCADASATAPGVDREGWDGGRGRESEDRPAGQTAGFSFEEDRRAIHPRLDQRRQRTQGGRMYW